MKSLDDLTSKTQNGAKDPYLIPSQCFRLHARFYLCPIEIHSLTAANAVCLFPFGLKSLLAMRPFLVHASLIITLELLLDY
jgi:hypothetical protein